mmetsp:Transcript_125940/g.352634  ORF Transcript_125940/g.352634 Transcript_125940/m.352634 type:complete len:166 (-) Transcript_125940:227-724(-)
MGGLCSSPEGGQVGAVFVAIPTCTSYPPKRYCCDAASTEGNIDGYSATVNSESHARDIMRYSFAEEPEQHVVSWGGPPQLEAIMVFELPDGSVKPLTFTRKPLGLDFSKSMPLIVRGVSSGSAGEELGVQCGWRLIRVAGMSLDHMPFQHASTAYSQATIGLPRL